MAYDPFRSYTGVLDRKMISIVPGGSAGAIALPGITLNDRLLRVQFVALAGTPAGTNDPIVTGFAAGKHVVTAGEDTAGTVSIDTGLTGPDAINVMILRAGVPIFSDQAVSISGANIVVADGGATYQLTEDDEIHWFAYDASDASLTAAFTGDGLTPTGTPADLTSEFSISDTDEIDNTGGTDTSDGYLFVEWEDHDLGETSNPAHLDDNP